MSTKLSLGKLQGKMGKRKRPFELARLRGGSFMRKACALWREEYANVEGGCTKTCDSNLEPSLAHFHTTLPRCMKVRVVVWQSFCGTCTRLTKLFSIDAPNPLVVIEVDSKVPCVATKVEIP